MDEPSLSSRPRFAALDSRPFHSYRRILLIAGPLILSQLGVMLMQFVDGLFLARYSTSAIAAMGPAGLTFWLLCGLFIGVVGYSSTFVAQYVGAGRSERVGAAVWQGIYLALLSAAILAVASLGATRFFDFAGHDPAIRTGEVTYFRILCWGAGAFMLSSALSGFYTGRNDNRTVMIVHLFGTVLHGVLDWALIFGRLGMPDMGVAGAAWATVLAQASQFLIMAVLLFLPRHRRDYGTWRDRAFDKRLLSRMCVYGFPNGVRFVIEILAWTVFLLLMGRIGPDELAASNIVWRINGFAFYPVIGLSIAVSMLVGQAQGAARPELAEACAWRGLALGEVWMAAAAAGMVLFPQYLLSPFFDDPAAPASAALIQTCTNLLWFVAAYSLIDGFNIILMGMLAGAGDTRWMVFTSGALHLGFVMVLAAVQLLGGGLYAMWAAATVFITVAALTWVVRVRSGRWKAMRVIEHVPPDIPAARSEAPHTAALGAADETTFGP